MRLFTGIDLPEQVVEHLERLLARLRPTAHLRWSPVYNLHITTKFIGERPQQDVTGIIAALSKVRAQNPISISIEGLGWFPNPHSPRVFWAGVHGGQPLADLAKSTEDALEPLGVAREMRGFSPHLTLARIGQPVPLQSLRNAVDALDSNGFGTFGAAAFHLYLSKPGAAGSVYSKLETFPLAA